MQQIRCKYFCFFFFFARFLHYFSMRLRFQKVWNRSLSEISDRSYGRPIISVINYKLSRHCSALYIRPQRCDEARANEVPLFDESGRQFFFFLIFFDTVKHIRRWVYIKWPIITWTFNFLIHFHVRVYFKTFLFLLLFLHLPSILI